MKNRTYEVACTVINLAFLAAGVVGIASMAHADSTPAPLSPMHVVAQDVPVQVDAADDTIVLPEVRIVVRRPGATATVRATDCAFDWRPVVQGPVAGEVQGFCGQ